MRVFGRLESGFWDNPKVAPLTDQQKLLLSYLFSCKHGNSIGCYVLREEYIAADLGWSVETASNCLSVLIERKFVNRDSSTKLIKVRGWWGHNAVDNPNHAKSAVKSALSLPASSLKDETIAELRHLANTINPKAAEVLREGLQIASEAHPNVIAITETDTETDTEKEKEKEKDTELSAGAPPADRVYAFMGSHYVQGVTEEQMSEWLRAFTTLKRRDVLDELGVCDQYYKNHDKPPKNWLQAATSWLKKEHQVRMKEKRKEREQRDTVYAGVRW
jgi:hypothetical protein